MSEIKQLQYLASQYMSYADRVEFFSSYFLDSPYLVAPQSEEVLFRFDGFDCVTFVNNILALVLSNTPEAFLSYLVKISYYNGVPTFENRLHFISCDWNVENNKNSVLKDVTQLITDSLDRSVVLKAVGDINKPAWFLRQGKPVPVGMKVQHASILYLPLSQLFNSGVPNSYLFSQIPDVAIVEIVRPNWNLLEKIGTSLHVSHLGFSLKNSQGVLRFRHASSEKKSVVDVDLIDYLGSCLEDSSIGGINVQAIV